MSVWGIIAVVVGIIGGWLSRREGVSRPFKIAIIAVSVAIILFCIYMIFARVR